MRGVRVTLLLGWFLIILSLFYDPLTPWLTDPDNLASPFRIHPEAPTLVQGVPLPLAPYPMTSRIFWSMVVPLVPIALMLFGHETWRRICPISFVGQIPRILGWQRKTSVLIRSAGRVDRVIALIPSSAWLRRNQYTVQFWMLALGVLGRILFYNSDRLSLAAAFATIMILALAVGLLYGGKTWCNYFCPLAVIQATYTGPGGLLDSKAHLVTATIAQSMCRAPGATGDASTCVGCNANCPDVDLENSYWRRVESDSKRFMYYGLFGLIVAFYSYYYVYSGNWDYYMSGVWTHEPGQLATLLGPGFYFDGQAIAIPKIIAAPLYFLFWIFFSYGFFVLVERLYAFASPSLPKALLRHRMLTVTAFLSFNVFYFFAGRPNILLMQPWAIKAIDLGIDAVSIAWLIRSLSREAEMYRRESLAGKWRQQLARMGFRAEEALEGQSLDQLSADEVYVLAKTLPNSALARKRAAWAP
jgi:hypothetical protein